MVNIVVWKGPAPRMYRGANEGARQNHGRVAPGNHSPEAPTDPDVRISRIRLFGSRLHYVTGGGTDARLRKRIPLEQSVHFLPRYPCPLRAATQPLPPHDDAALSELAERPQVADDGEVLEVPQQLPRECCPLFANRFMAVTPTP